jgi:acetyltransferase-like isoleucine patch superfamily enzyme
MSIIEKIGGRNIKFDSRVPRSYLWAFMWRKGVSLIRGILRLHRLCFVSDNCIIRGKTFIKTGRGFSMEEGCYVDALSERGLVCGNNVHLGYQTCIRLTGSMSKIGKGAIIGDNVGLGTHGFYGSGMGLLQIGSDTIIGNYCSFHPENHIHIDLMTPIRLQGVSSGGGVKIGSNCWIGAKCTFLDGAEIGNGCIVAAGAVVTKKFSDNCVIGGVPAKILKMRT